MVRISYRTVLFSAIVAASLGVAFKLGDAGAQTLARPQSLKPPPLVKPQTIKQGPKLFFAYRPMRAYVCDKTEKQDTMSQSYENAAFIAISPETKPKFGEGSTFRIAEAHGMTLGRYKPVDGKQDEWICDLSPMTGRFQVRYDSDSQVVRIRRTEGMNREPMALLLEVSDPTAQTTFFANVIFTLDRYRN
jgi:hypothetical protein